MKLRLFFSFLLVVFVVSEASATCMEDFQIRLTNPDCSDPGFIDLCDGEPNCSSNPIWLWPSNEAPMVAVSSSTTCCGPPMSGSDEGTCSTDEHDAATTRTNLENSGALMLSDGDFVMVPNFVATQIECGNEAVFVLNSLLDPAEGYMVGVYNMYSCNFNIFEASGPADPAPQADVNTPMDVGSDPGHMSDHQTSTDEATALDVGTEADESSSPDPGLATDESSGQDQGVVADESTAPDSGAEADGGSALPEDASSQPEPDTGNESTKKSSSGCSAGASPSTLWSWALLLTLIASVRLRRRIVD